MSRAKNGSKAQRDNTSGMIPKNEEIPLSVPQIGGNEWSYIKECLDTNWVSSAGKFVERFEREIAEYLGTRHAVAVVNGTAALHLALLAAGVGADDEVLISDLTFIAPVNAIRYANARPIFIDADPTTWQINPILIKSFLENGCRRESDGVYNLKSGRRVRAIIPVHILGHPVDMDPIIQIAESFGLTVIEDATEGLGATYKGKKVGSLADMACLSFNGNKLITTGGGGMLVTDNDAIADTARYLSTQAKDDPVEYIHNQIGYNYRLTNIQAAMGCAQLEKISDYISSKRRITKRYIDAFLDVDGITPMPEASWAQSACWLFTALFDQTRYGLSSRQLMEQLAIRKIQSRPLWNPIHLNPPYQDCSFGEFPTSELLNSMALSLPCSVGLSENDQESVIDTIIDLSHRK